MTRRAQARRTIGAGIASVLVFAMLGTGSSGAATLLEFEKPVRVPGSVGYEPGIDIAADGTIFTNEPRGVLTDRSDLYRSTNGGTSYSLVTFPSPYSRLPGGGDSDVETAIGPNGTERVYFIDLWAGSYSIIISDDNGETWSFGSPLSTPIVDRAWIESGGIDPATGEQKVYIVTSSLGATGLQFSRSNDGGRTWGFHRTVPGIPGAGGQSGQLVADGDFLAFPYNSGSARHVAYSTDAGDNWTTKKVSYFQSAEGSISSMARDASTGALHTVWQDRFATKGIRLASSYNNGLTWNLEREIWAGGRSLFPWIDARDGKVAVVWFSSDGYVEDPNATTAAKRWYVKYSESTDNGVTFSAPITVGGPGPDNAVKKGAICTNGLGCDADRELGDFLQVAIDAQGRSRVAYGSTLKIQGASLGMHVATQKLA